MSELVGTAMPTISVVTPTLNRPEEVRALLTNLAAQQHVPLEVVLVDAGGRLSETRVVVQEMLSVLPYKVIYILNDRGTAIQRNVGIDAAQGELVAFIDDDMLLESNFLTRIVEAFSQDQERRVAAVAGYVTNQYFDAATSRRWVWYRRLGLFTTYEPGRFDYETGYVINRHMQAPHEGIREIDCMGANCAVWRRDVFNSGVRFSPFFVDYGVGEDAHIALTARKAGWTIWECGRARCVHQQSLRSRENPRRIAWKTAVNYRFLFVDVVPHRSLSQEFRFWRVQLVELAREVVSAIQHRRKEDWASALGKLEGIIAAMRVHHLDTVPSAGIGHRTHESVLTSQFPESDPGLDGMAALSALENVRAR
jgi:glycosyltransferase involved in cell wall biosynthesis